MKLSPVIIFAYNRPDHLYQTLMALASNELASTTSVFIFIDGPKDKFDIVKVGAVQGVAEQFTQFLSVEIRKKNKNLGLAASIINGVSEVLQQYESVIVLEDDLITSASFLNYMNDALEKYRYSSQVMSVSAFGKNEISEKLKKTDEYDAYFIPRNSSWGWGTWRDSWLLADWGVGDYRGFSKDKNRRKQFSKVGNDVCLMLDLQQCGLIDSWAIRWTYAHFSNSGVSLIPYQSYVQNIGFDGSGTNCRVSTRFLVDLSKSVKFANLPDSICVKEANMVEFCSAHKQKIISHFYWKARLLARQLGFL